MSITFNQVSYTYQPNTPMAFRALYDVSFNIPTGSYTAIIGHTGSGKSTILQHLNALLKPTAGQVQIEDYAITAERTDKELVFLRKKVGIVFQFPEAQLFEESVVRDIAFGPMNFGMPEADALALARKMLRLVDLDEQVAERSPFDLSGGQMRRVAIAGVLALEPEVLVLDEPTAGLDPKGRRDMMAMFKRLHDEQGLTIVLVTHQMDDVAEFADHVVVMHQGSVLQEGTPQDIFRDIAWLRDHQLDVPRAKQLLVQAVADSPLLAEAPLQRAALADWLAARWHEQNLRKDH